MSKKIYVGNLPFSITDADLKKMFESYGQLGEVVIIKDKFNGRSKGFGFVTVEDDAEAERAVSELNGKDMEGRALTVNEARPMDPDRPRKSFGGGRSSGGFGGGRREGGFRRERY